MVLNMLFDNYDLLMDSPNSTVKMRKLILQLAVQGKLVEQDPNDEPASELLKRIKAEKEKLIAEGKIKKQKPLLPITEDEIPYELPQRWESIRIGNAINMINGRAFKPLEWNTVGLPIIRIQNLNNPMAPYNYCDFDVDQKFHLKDGDFLISWSGTPGTSFGAFIWDRGPAVLNQHIFRCGLYGDSFFRPYLRLAINAQLDEMISQAHGGVGLQHITKGKLEKIVATLPPFAEQKRIVAKVDQLMQLCDQLDACQKKAATKYESLNDAALEKLLSSKTIDEFANHWQFICNNFDLIYNEPAHVNKLRQAILQLAVQGKLAPQDPNDEPASELLKRINAEKEKLITEGKIKKQKLLPPIAEDKIPYELPQGWTWVRLGAIVEDERGITYGIVKMGIEPRMGGVKTLRCSDVKYRKIDLTNVRMVSKEISQKYKRTILKGHEILINIRGTLGGCCIAPEEIEGYNIAREIAMVPILKQIESSYVLDVLSSPYIQKTTFDSLRGIAYKGLNLNLLTSFLIPLPSLAEQKRIVAKVDQLINLCDELETRLNQSKKDSEMLMQAVLHEALS